MHNEELTIKLPWGIISGIVWGNRNDTPVLMVHGVQDSAGTFDNLLPLLPQQGFCYICFDLPGHGQSSHYPAHMNYTLMSYVQILSFIVIEYLKLDRFYFIGHSMGGHIGYLFTGIYPEKVVKLLTIDSVLHRIAPDKQITERIREQIDDLIHLEQRLKGKVAPKYSYNAAIDRVCRARVVPIPESIGKVLAKRSLVENNGGFSFTTDQRLKLNVLSDFNYNQYKNIIDHITCPVVVILASITSEAQKIVIKKNHQLLRNKNFKHFIVEGSHDVHLIDPGKIAPIVSNFLLTDIKSKL